MILPSLIDYYDRLEADPETDVAAYGFSRQKISFVVTLDSDGRLIEIADGREAIARGKKTKFVSRQLVVPGQAKPSGIRLNPCFLWDNAAYLLGWKADDPKPERTRASFEAFREHHLALLDQISDEGFQAVGAFLRAWDPDAFEPDEETVERLQSFGVFRLASEQRYIHEHEQVVEWYKRRLDAPPGETPAPDGVNADPLTPSLTSGQPCRVARLHEPKIKGVWGGQSAGAKLVSFNNDAFESYGKNQGDNAPVSERDAFKYCTALTRLLADDERHTTIGDATVVWWTDGPTEDAEQIFRFSLGAMFPDDIKEALDDPEAEVDADVKRLSKAVKDIAAGRSPSLDGTELRLNVLGLSPNAARLSVRFWWRGPMSDMIDHIAKHHADARLEPVPDFERHRPLTVYRMVRETARVHGDRSDMDTISPVLSGELARAVLSGTPYPQSLLETIVRRVRTDGRVNHARVSITKACITRRRRLLGRTSEEVPVSLDLDGPAPYQLGRLFAVLEKTQSDALGDVDANIRERYFGSACATPASVFPRLCRLTQHHLGKLSTGQRIHREKLMQEIIGHVSAFPRHYALEQQGLFQIGYYHQRQDLFTTRSTETTPEENDQ